MLSGPDGHTTVLAHELGHGFEIEHSFDHSDRQRQFAQKGEYFDPYDIMSANAVRFDSGHRFSPRGPLLNTANLDRMGWLPPGRVWRPAKNSSGVHEIEIAALSNPEAPGYLAAQAGGWIAEFRMPSGFDAGLRRPTLLLHDYPADPNSFIVDSDASTPGRQDRAHSHTRAGFHLAVARPRRDRPIATGDRRPTVIRRSRSPRTGVRRKGKTAMRTKSLLGLGAAALLVGEPALAVNCALKDGVTVQQGREGLCGFEAATRSFRGTPAQQAECLTRAVGRGAAIGAPTLTPFLRARVGQPTNISRARLAAFLAELNVDPANLGGPIAEPVSARYFIIHDTSTPNCSEEEFSAQLCPARGVMPPNRDTPQWAALAKFFGHPMPFPNRLAHAFTNRIGDSITEVPFSAHISTTKFEGCTDAEAKKGLFLGIENIQPRIGLPAVPASGKKANDLIAPVPGFSPAQYRRLALLYMTASVRQGRWLIPAFHAVVDGRYADGHDDPQNFDMPAFSAAVKAHLDKLAP